MYNEITGLYEGYVYVITNNVNGKKYVGQTRTTLKERFMSHHYSARSNELTGKRSTPIYNAMVKYGVQNFTIEELYKVCAIDHETRQFLLNEVEKLYIKRLNTLTPNGYNVLEGGQCIPKDKIRRTPVFMVDENGSVVNKFDSIADAGRNTGIHPSLIEAATRRNSHHCKGYFWFVPDNAELSKEHFDIAKKTCKDDGVILGTYKTCMFLKDGTYVITFNSSMDAYRYMSSICVNSFNKNSISECCRKNLDSLKYSCKNFMWCYEYAAPDGYLNKSLKNMIGDDLFNDYISFIANQPKTTAVEQLSLEGEVLNTFFSVESAADHIGSSKAPVYECCEGVKDSFKGFKWRYAPLVTPNIFLSKKGSL